MILLINYNLPNTLNCTSNREFVVIAIARSHLLSEVRQEEPDTGTDAGARTLITEVK